MKFRIIRDYDEFQPQVCCDFPGGTSQWKDIGYYRCYTIEEAKKACADYKQMVTNKVVEEFEL